MKEDIGMGKKWNFYGSRGLFSFDSEHSMESSMLENPWEESQSTFVIPYYFDKGHSMSADVKITIENHLDWFNYELNHCIRFEKVNETIARTLDRKLHIVDGSGCWSYLGAIP